MNLSTPIHSRSLLAATLLLASWATQAQIDPGLRTFTPQAVEAFAELNFSSVDMVQLNFTHTGDVGARNADIDVTMQIIALDGTVVAEDRARVASGLTHALKFDSRRLAAAVPGGGPLPLRGLIKTSVAGQVCDRSNTAAAASCEQAARALLAKGRGTMEQQSKAPSSALDPAYPPDPYLVQIQDRPDTFFVLDGNAAGDSNPAAFGLLLPAVRTGAFEVGSGDRLLVQIANQPIGNRPSDITFHNPPSDHNPPGDRPQIGDAQVLVRFFDADGQLLSLQDVSIHPSATGVVSYVVPNGLAPCVHVAIVMLSTATADGQSKLPYARLQAGVAVQGAGTQNVRVQISALANPAF